MKGYGGYITNGMKGNFYQLQQLQELVEYLLRSSKNGRVELVFDGVEWSCVRCLDIFS